jgi:hypothetical protein
MPSPSEILAGLSRIANDAIALAILWHIVIAAIALQLSGGWRPTQSTARILVALPLASASALAFRFGNPFNGSLMALLCIALIVSASRAPQTPAAFGSHFAVAAGAISIAFAWVYPHFLVDRPAWQYLFASPMGLVPCPTLALVIGSTLVFGGLGSRAISLLIAAFGLFYGVFGIVRLGVTLDVGLLLVALALAAFAISTRTAPQVLRGGHAR